MMTAVDARRRWFGAFFLVLAGGLLIWGRTVFKEVLVGWSFLIYWLVCFLFTGLAMVVALLDIRAVRRDVQARQKEIWDKTLCELGPKPQVEDHGLPGSEARPAPKARSGDGERKQ